MNFISRPCESMPFLAIPDSVTHRTMHLGTRQISRQLWIAYSCALAFIEDVVVLSVTVVYHILRHITIKGLSLSGPGPARTCPVLSGSCCRSAAGVRPASQFPLTDVPPPPALIS